MGKKAASTRSKKRSKKQQQSISTDTDDDSDSERPLSAYEQERMRHIRSNQETLDKLDARLDMSDCALVGRRGRQTRESVASAWATKTVALR